jgi:hypothetical protein
VHPTDLSYGIICNAMIDAVDRTFGSSIPHVDLSSAATATASRVRPVHGRKLFPRIEGFDQSLAVMFPWRRAAPPASAALRY